MLSSKGEGKGRTYSLSKKYEMEMSLINEAVKIGLKEMIKTKGQKRAGNYLNITETTQVKQMKKSGRSALCVFNWAS